MKPWKSINRVIYVICGCWSILDVQNLKKKKIIYTFNGSSLKRLIIPKYNSTCRNTPE
jgi:hypothetical protein